MRKRTPYRVPAVVVGAGLNGLGVVRSLGRAAVPVTVVDSDPSAPAMRSRYVCTQVYDPNVPGDLLDTLERIAQAFGNERAVLFLTQEEPVAMLTGHRACLESLYRFTMADPDVVVRLLHKDGFRSLANATGARIPKTRRLQDSEEFASLDDLGLPWIIKPALRDAGYSTHFAKAYRVDDRDTACALLRRILAVLPDVIVQEWIEGDDTQLYFCLAYMPASGADPTTFVGRKLRCWPPQVGGTARCAPAPEASSLARTTVDFFKKVGVSGLASIEYKRHARSGDYLMVEPTIGRTDYQHEVATLNGVNIVLAAYRDVLGLDPLPHKQSPTVRVWRDRVSDLQSAAVESKNQHALSKRSRIVDALWRARDPMPALVPWYGRVQNRLVRLAGGARAANDGGRAT